MFTNDLKELIWLLNQGKTANQVCDSLKIKRNELLYKMNILSTYGRLYKSTYYSTGDIVYKPITNVNSLNNYEENNTLTLITGFNEKNVDILVLSDLHIGNKLADLDLAKYAFDYMKCNNIHVSFLTGDIIDGTFSKTSQNINDVYYQAYEFIDKYPFDKNIITFGVLGDHDESALKEGLSVKDIIKYNRNDIIVKDYRNTFVNIKNDSILLVHKLEKELDTPSLTIEGHYHLFDTNLFNNKLNIKAPSLSNINYNNANAIHLTLSFNNGYIENVYIKAIKLGKSNETIKIEKHSILLNEELINERVLNEDGTFTKKLDVKNSERIIKFKKKYGL